MSRFGSDPLAFFKAVYQNQAPWDMGAPQPAMVALLQQYPPQSPILDLGCGSGDLAIYLAQQGYQVVGIDFVETAIKNAQARVELLPPEIAQRLSFQVADALKPSQLQRQFGAVMDSGFYHLFNPDQGDLLIDEVAAVLQPQGDYYLHEFAFEFLLPHVPRQITAAELQTRFTAERGWTIKAIQSAEFLNRVAAPVPAITACIRHYTD